MSADPISGSASFIRPRVSWHWLGTYGPLVPVQWPGRAVAESRGRVSRAVGPSALVPDGSDVTAGTKDGIITVTGVVRTWA